MLDLTKFQSLGEALRAALERWPDEVCLIESNRERENARLTYRKFKEAALPLAGAMQRAGLQNGTRAAILMTNQSKWLISAYAIFFGGGVLVPLDYKIAEENPAQILQLLHHSAAEFLVVEYFLFRKISQTPEFQQRRVREILVTEAPENADLGGARRWENFRDFAEPAFVPRERKDAACIVYSSGTSGQPKGCVLTHENYLEQCVALTSLYPFWPGVKYLSILPTNHAIDFMVGFIGPFTCGATVVHLRTLRPEFVVDAFTRYKITYMALVPAVLVNLEKKLRERFAELPKAKRVMLNGLIAVNRASTRKKPNVEFSRRMLADVHKSFGGELRTLFVGGAYTAPETLDFFYGLGIPVANGYGCTESGTVISVNDLKPFRADTVGKALPGVEIQVANPGEDGVGEIRVRSKMVMSHYLDDPEMTAETIVDGWLRTGDLGFLEPSGHLKLLGRAKNMIVTEEGKNICPEEIEPSFVGIGVKEYCVTAANFVWPERKLEGEKLILVLHPEEGHAITPETLADIAGRNNTLKHYKRVSGYVAWDQNFPLTASMKLKRAVLAEQIRASRNRSDIIPL